MKHFIFITIIMFFVGCGSSVTSPMSQDQNTSSTPAEQETPNSAENIFTIGDDQNVLEGQSVYLQASILDNNKTFEKFTWKANGTIISQETALSTDTLTEGTHDIILEVVDADGTVYVDTMTVTIKKDDGTNTQPKAEDITIQLEEDSTATSALLGSDADGDGLSYLFISQPSHGALSGSSARLRYTPDANFHGTDSFQYKTNDGTIDSNLATVSILVTAVNDAPTWENTTINTQAVAGSLYSVDLPVVDIDSDLVTITASDNLPSWLTIENHTLKGQPTLNDIGTTPTITFTVSDGDKSANTEFAITVNDPRPHFSNSPIMIDTNEDNPSIQGMFTSDKANTSFSYSPLNSVIGFNLNLDGTYSLDLSDDFYQALKADENYTATLTITVTDGTFSSDQNMSIMIRGINDKPTVIDDYNSTNEDTNITFNLLLNDTDVDNNANLTLVDVNETIGFTFSADGNLTFSPTNRYDQLSLAEEQNITITYTIADEQNATSEATATITIIGLDDIVSVDTINTQESNLSMIDGNISGRIFASDPDSDVTYNDTNNSDGFDINASGHYTYSPLTGLYNYLSEGEQETITIPIMISGIAYNIPITIIGKNDAPTVQNQSTTIPNDINATFTLTAEDIDSTHFTYEILSADVNGTHTLVGNTFTYTPDAGSSGIVVYDYRVIDDFGAVSNTATLTIDVGATNFAPVAENMTITLDEDSTEVIDLNASDANGDHLSYYILTPTANGNLTLNGGQATYQPNGNFHGSDSFTYYASDSVSSSNTATVTIHVNTVNDAPIANPDNNTTNEDTNITFNILANDSDVDANAILTLIDINSSEGNVTFTSDGNLTFSPIGYFDTLSAGEEHNVTLTYLIQDEHAASAEANVTITITGVDDAPQITSIDTININENITMGTGQIVASDAESTTLTYESNSTLISIDNNGTYTFNTDNLYNYLTQDETKIIPIMITISDGDYNITQEINITVIGVNTPPTIEIGDDYNIIEGESISFGITSSGDVDGTITQYSWELEGAEVSTNTSFEHNFTTAGDYNVTLTVTDDKNATAADTLMVHVSADTSGGTTFTSHAVTNNAVNNEWLEMVDIDLDGDLDILTAGDGGTKVGWYENRGDFTFDEHVIATDAYESEAIKTIDINNDGVLDILYTTYTTGASLMQCLNDGNASFSTCTPITNATDGLSYIEIVDMDGDDKDDIITASWSASGDDKVEWLKNEGDGTFSGPHHIQDVSKAISIATADFDKDGFLSVVSASEKDSEIALHEYNTSGNGDFIHDVNITGIPSVYSVNVADINGDGYDDIISAAKSDGTIYWHKNTKSASESFEPKVAIATGLTSVFYASGADMDNDGDIDIISASSDPMGKISWYENENNGISFTEHIVHIGINDVIRVFPADIDNDGNMDIVAGQEGGLVRVYENNAPTTIISFAPTSGGSFIRDDDKERVYDETTGLTWTDQSTTESITLAWDSGLLNAKSGCRIIGYRLPTTEELLTITDKNLTNPSINSTFQHTASNLYWTSEESQENTNKAWDIDFGDGTDSKESNKNSKLNVRCVKGDSISVKLLRNDTLNVVVDQRHNIMWQDNNDVTDNTKDWTTAQSSCANLDLGGYSTGWRLPTINELYSITDKTKSTGEVAIKDAFFYKTNGDYWSSTELSDDTNKVHGVSFKWGEYSENRKDSSYFLRCIREID